MGKKTLRIKNLIPLTNGIFSHMDYTFREEVTKQGLDTQFLANNGMRNVAPIVELIDDGDGTVFDNTKLNTLAALILETYKSKWDKLGEIYDIQYDPIHNYLDEWEEDDDITGSVSDNRLRTDTFTHGKIVTEDTSRNDIGSQTVRKEEDTSSTRTDNLASTETRDLDATETITDNLQEETSYGKTDTRTDNLSEALTKTGSENRTDNLQEETFYGKKDTRTDDLKHEIKGTETRTPDLTNTGSVYAINSAIAVPTMTDAQTGTQTLSFTNRENDDTGTQTSQLAGSDRTKHTGTQGKTVTGSETTLNTGTQQDVTSGSDVVENTGTRTTQSDEGGTVTKANTGTQTLVGDNEETITSNTSNSRAVHGVTGYTGSDTSNESTSKSRATTDNIDKSGRHFGNIGNLTSQKQILEEINLWRWNYINEILNDVKEFTTLPVYLDAMSYYC